MRPIRARQIDCRYEMGLASDLLAFGPSFKEAKDHHQKRNKSVSSGLVHIWHHSVLKIIFPSRYDSSIIVKT